MVILIQEPSDQLLTITLVNAMDVEDDVTETDIAIQDQGSLIEQK
jgi:hypothetical protein